MSSEPDGRHHLGGGGAAAGGNSASNATGGGDLPPLRFLPGRRGGSAGLLHGAPPSANGGSAGHLSMQVLEASQYVGGSSGGGGTLSYGGAFAAPSTHASLAQQFEKFEAQYEQQQALQAEQLQQQQRFTVDPEQGRGGAGDSGSSKAAAAAGAVTPQTPATTRHNSRIALLSMLLLVFQGTALSIMLRYSRARAGQPYLASVSVIFTEAIKLIICLVMQYRVVAAEVAAASKANGSGTVSSAQQRSDALARELRRQARDIAAKSLPMLLPAAMFVMQQVLLIIAATHLDAVAFQIFSQSFKLVPTALFAYWLLGQMLEPMQWASIPVLAVGVVLVTVNNGATPHGHRSAAATAAMSHSHGLDYVAGMVACSISGLSSAYAGVYFEKYVKGKHAASLWVRNIQLGIFGVPLSTGYALLKDGWQIHTGGLMQGFDAATWMVIALQVFGGLVTGMVVKYCDNILKNFALAISVILTVLVAVPLFGQWPSPIFLVGVSLVLLSVFMYGRALDARKLHLLWQRARRRLHDVGSSRGRRLALLLLLAGAAALGVLLLGGGMLGQQAGSGRPLTKQGGGGGAGQLVPADFAAEGTLGEGREGGAAAAAGTLAGGRGAAAGGRKGAAGSAGGQRQQQQQQGQLKSGGAGADGRRQAQQQQMPAAQL